MASSEYRLPALPFGRSEATILRWLKQPSDRVAAGDPLVIVVNNCAEVALPAGLAGSLTQHLLPEGALASAGAPLASFAPLAPGAEPPRRITPVARRVALDGGIDPLDLAGSGASGRVTKADVLAALAPQPSATSHPNAASVPALHAPRQAPGLIQLGADTSALTAIEVDLEHVRAARARLSADFTRRGLALSDTVCVMAAVAAALPCHPLLNSSWHADDILIRRRVNLALDSGGRRVVVRDAQDLNIRGLARALRRSPQAGVDDSTFAIVEYQPPIWWGAPALAPRHSATLGVGAPRARPAVATEHGVDRVALRRLILLSLVYDARVLGQCHADAFLCDLKARLEQFNRLML